MLELVRCPITGSRLTEVESGLLAEINRQIERKQLVDRSGVPVEAAIEQALVNENQTLLIPIREGVVNLIAEELIPIAPSNSLPDANDSGVE